jgi:dTMP kinase
MTTLSGKFIVFDGGEGCGKSTQAGMLAQRLAREGRTVLSVHDPGTTRIGAMIRKILLDPANNDMAMRAEMLLYMAARAQMMSELILPALSRGEVVISDRFVSSTLAYQLGGDALTADEIRAVADVAIKHRWPDLTIILDMPTQRSMERVRPKFTLFPDDPTAGMEMDRIELRSISYHETVRQNYLTQAQSDPAHYRIIDGSRAPDDVHHDVYKAITALR